MAKKNQKYVQGFTRGTVKDRKSVMVWLVIASDGSSKLLRCDQRQDSASYQQTILTPSLNFIRSRVTSRRQSIIFKQDGASCHTSVSTTNFLKAHRVNLLPWPAQSPD